MQLYNSLTHQIEEFKSIKKNKIGLYTCGPTVYNYAHLGNLRTYIFEDVLKRVLVYNNYKIKHVMNITDVGHLTSDGDEGEDKMEKGAQREGKSAWDIATFYTEAFKKDLSALNILEPDIWCKATDHIKEQIKLIKKLEKNKFTYRTADGIYFDTSKLADYGKMANLKNQELRAGVRVDIGDKKNTTDFALWKFSPKLKKRQMEWESPWGVGFPGWHIECSAMSEKYLGQPFDIHCGGIDHIPVHLTNEIAQSEAVNGKHLANYWLHGEFLLVSLATCPNCGAILPVKKEGKYHNTTRQMHYMNECPQCSKLIGHIKMAKSGENFLTLETIKNKGLNPLAYRYFALQTHYRKQLTFSWPALQAAENGLKHFYETARNIAKNDRAVDDRPLQEQFLARVNNNLDLPGALALIWEVMKERKINLSTLLQFDTVLGLKIEEELNKKEEAVPEEVQKLLDQRTKARSTKNWAESDRLRDEIKKLGYEIEDTKDGQKVVG